MDRGPKHRAQIWGGRCCDGGLRFRLERPQLGQNRLRYVRHKTGVNHRLMSYSNEIEQVRSGSVVGHVILVYFKGLRKSSHRALLTKRAGSTGGDSGASNKGP